jgi:hypothetical protein
MLEAHHSIVGEARDDHITARVPGPPLVQVEDVVQVDVREQRRCPSALRTPSTLSVHAPSSDDPRGHALLDQPQDALVRNPMLKEPHQPAMVSESVGTSTATNFQDIGEGLLFYRFVAPEDL